MGEKLKTDPADDAVIEAAATGQGCVELNLDSVRVLADAAKVVHDDALAEVRSMMTEERAKQVRAWRVDEGYTWRAVARAGHSAFAGQWEPSWNQLAGMVLCEVAAGFFGEDYMQPPWN